MRSQVAHLIAHVARRDGFAAVTRREVALTATRLLARPPEPCSRGRMGSYVDVDRQEKAHGR